MQRNLKIRSSLLIYIECAYISLGTFYSGYNIAVFNQSQTCIEIVNGWSSSDRKFFDGLLTSLLPLGAILGSILTGAISEKVGKRLCLICMDLIGIFGNFIMIFPGAPLFIGRFITGIPTGANTVTVPSYINEISPTALLPKMGSIISIMINFGIFFAFVLGLHLPNEDYMIIHKSELQWWKFMLTFPVLVCFIRILLLIFFVKTDTPNFYISSNRDEDAKTVLRKYYYEDGVDVVFNDLKKKNEFRSKSNIIDLFNYKMKRRLLVGFLLSVFQQFSGINAVIFYSNEIFMNSEKGNDYYAKLFTAMIGVILIITAYLSGKFLDKYGRRTIFLFGHFMCSLTLFFLMLLGWLNYDSPTKYLILAYIFSFGLSLGPVLFVYLPEILPEKGVGIAIMANWFSCFLIGLLFPIMLEKIDIEGCFLTFCAITFVGLIFTKFTVLETRSKSKEEIDEMFTDEKKGSMEEEEDNI